MKTLLLYVFAFFLAATTWAQEPGEQPRPPVPPPPPQAPSQSPKDDIVEFPSKEAKFKGGQKGLQKYIIETIQYPEAAIAANASGRIYLSFVIEKNGSITNVKVDKGAHPALNREAIRVVEGMPKWKPGKMHGKKVRTRARLPIVFTLK